MFKIIILSVALIFATLINSNAVEVSLKWKASISATGYRIFYGFSQDKMIYSVDAGRLIAYTVRNLDCGKQYYFHVKAYNDAGEAEPSNAVLVETEPCVNLPIPPENFRIDGLTVSPVE